MSDIHGDNGLTDIHGNFCMADIYGNPDPRYYRHMPDQPSTGFPSYPPFPGLCLIVELYAVFAFLYVLGLASAFPRTGWHDAILAVTFCLSCVAWTRWDSVKKIPYIGMFIYFLPGLSLIAVPFALDFYLIFGR
jgi:hypothetical protein